MRKLSLDASIICPLRTSTYQDVESTTIAVFERLKNDKIFASRLKLFGVFAPHYRDKKPLVINWDTSIQTLLDRLRGETRSITYFTDRSSEITLQIELNCDSSIVKEKIDGKLRNVPLAKDLSKISIYSEARLFVDPTFVYAFLSLTGDLFEILKGEYGWASHVAVDRGNYFDRHWYHTHLAEPLFIDWANFFGPPWVEQFGRERLLCAPAFQVQELPMGSILLTVAASPLDQLNPEVQKTISRVKSHLGILTPSERATPDELSAFEEQSKRSFEEIQLRITQAFQVAREKTASEMSRQAEGCAQGVRKFFGITLDFSPKSLGVIDKIILNKFNNDEDDETIETLVQAFGAYVGEVVRRNLGGDWRDEEMHGQPILFNVGEKKARLDPFEVVRMRFEAFEDHTGFELKNWYTSIGTS